MITDRGREGASGSVREWREWREREREREREKREKERPLLTESRDPTASWCAN